MTKKKRKKTKGSKTKTTKSKKSTTIAQYPKKLLQPVGKFLQSNLKKLERRKKALEKEDPFSNTARVDDNASPDTDAEEQFGHARTSAIREQIDRKIIQTRKALTRVKIGKYGICEDCGEFINTDRLMAYPEATLCAKDQTKREK